MKLPRNQWEFMEVIGKIACVFISMTFTYSLMKHIAPNPKMALAIAIIVNFLELLFFYYGKKNEKSWLTILGVIVAMVSVSSSMGYLQIGVERGAMQTTAYQAKLSEMESIQNQINTLNKTAARQSDIDHLKASRQTLEQSTPLLSQLGRVQKELDSIKESGAGYGTTIYKFYANIIGTKNVVSVAYIVNIVIAALIEIGAIWLNIKDVHTGSNNSKNIEKPNRTVNGERKEKRYRVKLGNGTVMYLTKDDIKEMFGDSDNGKIKKPNIFGFQVNDPDELNRSPKISDFENNVNEKIVHVNDFSNKKTLTKSVKKRSPKRGKSDSTILRYYDSWNVHSDGTFSYGKLSKVLKSAGVQVGKTYCYNVIKRERL